MHAARQIDPVDDRISVGVAERRIGMENGFLPIGQAVVQFERWTGQPAPIDVMRRIVEERL